jgi:alpha-L-fucosidase 2
MNLFGPSIVPFVGRIHMRQLFALIFLVFPLHAQHSNPLRLWYDQPAHSWNEALPIGNGRLAAMVFGIPEREQIQLNEETVWAGGPNNIKPDAYPIIQKARALLLAGKYEEAQGLLNSFLMPEGNSGMPYQPAGGPHHLIPGT